MLYQRAGTEFIDPASPVGRAPLNLVNVNLGLRARSGGWQIDGWVQNLFNQTYAHIAFPTHSRPVTRTFIWARRGPMAASSRLADHGQGAGLNPCPDP